MQGRSLSAAILLFVTACASHNKPVVFDLRPAFPSDVTESSESLPADASYEPIPAKDAALLGCLSSAKSPVCSTAVPSPEEDSAFREEGVRLSNHADARCRALGSAITANENAVRMYPKALMRTSGGQNLYGVGHAYEIDDVWMVRIARKINDLNDRTLEEKKRTLRHEMSHTLGATETPGYGWTAEDYAARCA